MKVKVKDRRRMKFQGTVYNPGDTVDLPENVAKRWIDRGRVDKVAPPKKKKAVSASKNKAVESSKNKAGD